MSNFSLERLEKLIQLPNVFLRHDVDFSLKAALKMAFFEEKRGIKAHFFLIYDENWPFYSPVEAMEAERVLYDLGHYVGVHVDERKTDLRAFRGPNLVSFHCPTENVLWKELDFPHCYEPRWQGHYYADSRGYFRYGDPEDDGYPDFLIQLNLHPEWWFEPEWFAKISEEDYQKYFYCGKTYVPQMFPRGFAESSDILPTFSPTLREKEMYDVGIEYYGEFITTFEYGYELLHGGMTLIDGKPGHLAVAQRYSNAVQLKWRYD